MQVATAKSLHPQITGWRTLLKVDGIAGFYMARKRAGSELRRARGEEGGDFKNRVGLAMLRWNLNARRVQPSSCTANLITAASGRGIYALGILHAGEFLGAIGRIDDRILRER